MLCERCKIREANIQYTEIVGGKKTEHHFCAQCAKELDFGPYSAIFDSDFPLGKLLSGLLGVNLDEEEEDSAACQVVCPTCKLSYEEFVKDSRFGCPDCYGVFDLLISDKIKQLQGSENHKGKRPKHGGNDQPQLFAGDDLYPETEKKERENAASDDPAFAASEEGKRSKEELQEEIAVLDARLKEALRREDYETAARCRDQIKELREEVGA